MKKDESFIEKWQQARRHARSWWGRLTEDDLGEVDGSRDTLVALLQEKYLFSRSHAEAEVQARLDSLAPEPVGVVAAARSAGASIH